MIFRLLLANAILLAVPLLLEFCVLLPLVLLHAIGGESLWLLSKIVIATAGIAVSFTILMAAALFFGTKNYITDLPTKKFSRWIMGLGIAFTLLIIGFAIFGIR